MRRIGRLWLALLLACGDDAGGAQGDAAADGGSDTGGVDASADATTSDAAPPEAGAPPCPAPTTFDNTTASKLTVSNDPDQTTVGFMGLFDPSFVVPAGASSGVLAYSAVPNQETIRTRVAVSTDGGAQWVYGADDPDTSRRWKLFSHRYLVGPGVKLHYRMGTITLQTSGAPTTGWSAPEKLIGWNSPAPYSSTGVVINASAYPAMADCLALTEPGAVWLPGSIHLAVGCAYLDGSTPRTRVELLRSTDHAASWQHVSTLLRPADTACIAPNASINAAELFAHDGTLYVAASPGVPGMGYAGCIVTPFTDIPSGTLRRDGSGRLVPHRVLRTTPPRFHGACAFAPGAGGYTVSVGFFDETEKFRMLRPGIAAP